MFRQSILVALAAVLVLALQPGAAGAQSAGQRVLKDRNGHVIGYLRTTGTRTRLLDRNGNVRGYYDAKTGHTYDRNGNVYATNSNVLPALLYE